MTLHAAGGLAILVATTLLAIYKPAGLTRIGARRLHVEHAPAPRWVKVSWVTAAGVAVLLVLMVVAGSHGPGAHLFVGAPS